jgi:hypothetical protein
MRLLPTPRAVAVLRIEALTTDLLELVLALALLRIGHDASRMLTTITACNCQGVHGHDEQKQLENENRDRRVEGEALECRSVLAMAGAVEDVLSRDRYC